MQPSGQRGRNRRPGIRVVELELMSRELETGTQLEPRVAAGPIALAGADVITLLLYLNLRTGYSGDRRPSR